MALKRKNLACNGDEPPQKYRRGKDSDTPAHHGAEQPLT
jgi:hypothetical protein